MAMPLLKELFKWDCTQEVKHYIFHMKCLIVKNSFLQIQHTNPGHESFNSL